MSAHQTTDTRNHELNVRMLRYRHRPDREEPALLARELLQRGRHADALELTELALAKEPGDADLEMVRAQALLAAGDTHRGEAELIRVARSAPQWAAPLSALTRILAGRGDENRAAQLAQRARTLGADDTMVGRLAERDDLARRLDTRLARFRRDAGCEEPVMLARALELAGRRDDAYSVLRAALDQDGDDADTLAALAKLERTAGRADEAVALYRKARALAPGWETVESALMSLVGVEVPIEVMDPRGRSAFGNEPSVVVDENLYAEARGLDLDAELDAFLDRFGFRGEATQPFATQRKDTTPGGWTADTTTLVGAPAIARTPRARMAPSPAPKTTRSNSGFPTRPTKRAAASAQIAYVRVLSGDARRHVQS